MRNKEERCRWKIKAPLLRENGLRWWHKELEGGKERIRHWKEGQEEIGVTKNEKQRREMKLTSNSPLSIENGLR